MSSALTLPVAPAASPASGAPRSAAPGEPAEQAGLLPLGVPDVPPALAAGLGQHRDDRSTGARRARA